MSARSAVHVAARASINRVSAPTLTDATNNEGKSRSSANWGLQGSDFGLAAAAAAGSGRTVARRGSDAMTRRWGAGSSAKAVGAEGGRKRAQRPPKEKETKARGGRPALLVSAS